MDRISLPYEDYFGEMDLDDEKIERRIALARRLEDAFSLFLTLYMQTISTRQENAKFLKEQLRMSIVNAVSEEFIIDDYISDYIDELVNNVIKVTDDKVSKLDKLNVLSSKTSQGTLFSALILNENDLDDKESTYGSKIAFSLWFLSIDRAIALAENESNTFLNYDEFRTAKEEGYQYKTWITEKDNKVRPTHQDVDDEKIPIEEAFYVGNYMMMFPKDTSLGAGAEEISNCRCTIQYS